MLKQDQYYYTVGILKMFTMNLVTLGGFQMYWLWKNFKFVKQDLGNSSWPMWRTLFYPLWAGYLFSFIQADAKHNKLGSLINPLFLGLVFLTINLAVFVPQDSIPFYYLLAPPLLSFLLLIPADIAARKVNYSRNRASPYHCEFSGWNKFIILGVLLFYGGVYWVSMNADLSFIQDTLIFYSDKYNIEELIQDIGLDILPSEELPEHNRGSKILG